MTSSSARQQSFSRTIQIEQPVPVVYAHLANPLNLIGLQPLLTWLLGWVIKQATNVQQQTLANLKSRLEAANTPSDGA
jgi:hypothetical protein